MSHNDQPGNAASVLARLHASANAATSYVHALLLIHDVLDGHEWNADTLEEIGRIVRDVASLRIREPGERCEGGGGAEGECDLDAEADGLCAGHAALAAEAAHVRDANGGCSCGYDPATSSPADDDDHADAEPYCTGCGREETECILNPCRAVLADRARERAGE